MRQGSAFFERLDEMPNAMRVRRSRVRKWPRPIQSLIVPKTCSTMHLAFIAQVPQLLDQYRLSVSPFSTVVKRQISCSPAGHR